MKNIITSNAINEAVATISLTVSLLKGMIHKAFLILKA